MTLKFDCSTTIAAPPERVFAALTDVDRLGDWMPGFVRMERVTPGSMGVGATFRETRKMFGHEATEQFEVTEFSPPSTFGLYVDGTKGSSKCGWYRFRYDLTPKDGGTLLVMTGEAGGMTGCMAFLGKFMVGPMKKALGKDLAALKACVEKNAARV